MPHAHLTLDVSADPGTLPRVIAIARRRGDIIALSYTVADRHRRGRIDLSVDTDLERLLRGRLANLVGVYAVR